MKKTLKIKKIGGLLIYYIRDFKGTMILLTFNCISNLSHFY